LQQVKQQELKAHAARNGSIEAPLPKRPKVLILAPTRELVKQITSVVKTVCHSIKLSSTSIVGGEDYGKQKLSLNRPIDIVVATPGRLLQHAESKHVLFSKVQHIVLDEMDTMLEQGFQYQLRDILHPLLYHKAPTAPLTTGGAAFSPAAAAVTAATLLVPTAPRIVLTSATMTQAIQKMIGDVSISSSSGTSSMVNARKLYRKADAADETTGSSARDSSNKLRLILPTMKVIKTPGLHKTVPRLKQTFVDVGSTDKMSILVDIIRSSMSPTAGKKERPPGANALTLIFCNTAASVRAVEYALSEAQISTLSYHGELNSAARSDNLEKFRLAGKSSGREMDELDNSQCRVLVATDLASRGLDVPQVDHVVMFDFPLNPLDYLHRSGRTARGSSAVTGKVTALVSKRDKVLANAIERSVQLGEPIDGLSSRKSDYQTGGRLDPTVSSQRRHGERPRRTASAVAAKPGRSFKLAGGGGRGTITQDGRRGSRSGGNQRPSPDTTRPKKQRRS
jgi:superfamily II DNA/RNA helicase